MKDHWRWRLKKTKKKKLKKYKIKVSSRYFFPYYLIFFFCFIISFHFIWETGVTVARCRLIQWFFSYKYKRLEIKFDQFTLQMWLNKLGKKFNIDTNERFFAVKSKYQKKNIWKKLILLKKQISSGFYFVNFFLN